MKLITSIILSIQLLTINAQGGKTLSMPKVDSIGGLSIFDRVNNGIDMKFGNFGSATKQAEVHAVKDSSGSADSGSTSDSGSAANAGESMSQSMDASGGSGANSDNSIPSNTLNDF